MGKWEKVKDVVSPRLSARLMVCVAERRWAVSVPCLCSICVETKEHAGIISCRASRMQCGEAVVPVSRLVEQVSVSASVENTLKKLLKTNFVVVSATLSGTQGRKQALASVSEEGPHTFLEIVRHCVASFVFNCCSHRPNHYATTCLNVACWKHHLIVRRVHVCTWKHTSSGRLRVCESQLSQVLIVGIGDFRCWLHLHCLAVQRELPRPTVRSVR